MSEKKSHSLKLNDYQIGDTIRISPLGRIKVARSRRTNELIALKTLIKSQIINSKQIPHIENEFDILPTLDHPPIISFIGSIFNYFCKSKICNFNISIFIYKYILWF